MRRSNGEHGPRLNIDGRIQRAKDYARAYCELGSTILVGERFGVSGQRVRQVLLEGHKNGWCRYSPNDRSCKFVAALPQLIVHSTSWKDMSKRAGYRCGMSATSIAKRIGISVPAISKRLAANRTGVFLAQLLIAAERLGARQSLNTTILQADKLARTALMGVQRRTGWSIDDIRKHVGLHHKEAV